MWPASFSVTGCLLTRAFTRAYSSRPPPRQRGLGSGATFPRTRSETSRDTAPDYGRCCRRPFRSPRASATSSSLVVLAEHGHVVRLEGGLEIGGVRRRDVWRLVDGA